MGLRARKKTRREEEEEEEEEEEDGGVHKHITEEDLHEPGGEAAALAAQFEAALAALAALGEGQEQDKGEVSDHWKRKIKVKEKKTKHSASLTTIV